MTNVTPDREQPRQSEARAAVFIDYENLHERLGARLDTREMSTELITEMLGELRRYLQELNKTQTAVVLAYADFGQPARSGQTLQKDLYLVGAEPRYVPATVQKNATELQLCVDAMDVLHTRPDIRTFVLLTGNRSYFPLVQQFKRYGCHAFVAALDLPEHNESVSPEEDFFLDARNLLSAASRQRLQDGPTEKSRRAVQGRAEEVHYYDVESDVAMRTLEIIEEFFGQYDEVYLTPLLRKLSELLGPDADPKALISELDDAGAVWLEKRSGSPYDYTVLLVDDHHPDVQAVQADLYMEHAGNGMMYSDDEYLEEDAYANDDLEVGETYTADSDSSEGESAKPSYIDEYDFSEPEAVRDEEDDEPQT